FKSFTLLIHCTFAPSLLTSAISLHAALQCSLFLQTANRAVVISRPIANTMAALIESRQGNEHQVGFEDCSALGRALGSKAHIDEDRKSTRLKSSHLKISYAGFCVKKIRAIKL